MHYQRPVYNLTNNSVHITSQIDDAFWGVVTKKLFSWASIFKTITVIFKAHHANVGQPRTSRRTR